MEDKKKWNGAANSYSYTPPDDKEMFDAQMISNLKKRIAELEERIAHVEEARKIQGSKGNWDMDEYMRGMYNSLEFAMCCLEDRDPVYKDPQESEGGADD